MAVIGVFDSGEGGLSVLREITRLLPEDRYVYYSDNAHCPYGEKSPECIIDRARTITERLLSEGADIIVVACNTATAAAIATLRAEYSDVTSETVRSRVLALTSGRHDHIRFIGMEPAVKPAALGTNTGVVGVLATAGTLKGSKYLHTKESVDDNVEVVEHVGQGFVELVENGVLSGPEAEKVVGESLKPLLEAGADIIVLGCTHYPFLLPVLQKVAGPDVQFIDPAPAVARQLLNVMKDEKLLPTETAASLLPRRHSGLSVQALASKDETPSSHGTTVVCAKQYMPDITLLSSGDPAPLHRLFRMLYGGSASDCKA